MSGEEILFVGDHLFSDVNVSKNLLRWRTALILRELETEIDALDAFRPREAELAEAMAEKERLEARLCRARLLAQRLSHGEDAAGASAEGVQAEQAELRARIEALDARIAPLARQAGETAHSRWGLIFRAGNDKSHLARQVERYADLYTSRVSNFLHVTPFAYLRAPRGTLPHDGAAGGSPLEG
jgi:chromosome segregation ATPase